jgi:hypothetical protein
MFNGDDVSFTSNRVHYPIWKLIATSAGLTPSPGKNYCTPLFVDINSTLYWVEAEKTEVTGESRVSGLSELFVLNPGLLKGQAKVMNDTRMDVVEKVGPTSSVMPYCDQLAEVKRVCPEEMSKTVDEIFFDHLKDRLESSQRSWNLPPFLGGLGLPFGKEPNFG